MRKKFIAFVCAFAFIHNLFAQSVAINADGSSPNSAAILDIKSTSKGILIPRMTTAQRTAVVGVEGLLVFDTDAGKFFYSSGSAWVDISTGTNYWAASGNNISNLNTAYVGIGVFPLANLDVGRGTSSMGTAMFRGSINISHFNYGTTEDTYIRGGKSTSSVIINDAGGYVGVGVTDPSFKLDVGNRMRLRSQGSFGETAGIWFNNYSNTDITGFIGEVGDGAPNHLGIFGATSGWQFVMNTVSGNVGINTFNTGSGNGKLNVRNNTDGNAIKLIGNGQYISFFDEANNAKCYVWNNGNDMVVSTNAANTAGELQLYTRSASGIAIQSDGRMRAGALACSITVPVNGVPTLPKISVQGVLGYKKSFGDQIGEWTTHYDEGNDLLYCFNGGIKAFIYNGDGSWDTFSDRQLKEEFKSYKSVLRDIQKLPVLTYHYKSNEAGIRSFGLVAQDVQQYFPEIIVKAPNGLLAMDYSKVGVLAVKAIQEQQVIIDNQQKEIDDLKKRLLKLEEKLR